MGAIANAVDGRIAILLRNRRTGATSRSGPRPTMLSIDPAKGGVLGLDFGETYMGAGLFDLAGNAIGERRYIRFAAAHNHEGALAWMRTQGEELVAHPQRLVGVGISVAAPVNPLVGEAEQLHGVIRDDRAMPDWAGINPAKELSESLGWGCPFELDNDANLAALAELWWGSLRGCQNALFVKWTSGIGCAVVLDGEIRPGAGGIAGELGHTEVTPKPGHFAGEWPVCAQCERTCLESVASVPDVLRDAGIDDFEEGAGLDRVVERLLKMVRTGDQQATLALTRGCEYVGKALGFAINLLNPEMVVIGGDFRASAYGEIRPPLKAAIRTSATTAAFADVSLEPGEQTGRASILGAAAKVLDNHLVDFSARL